MNKLLKNHLVLLTLILTLGTKNSLAQFCDAIDGVPDYNCDGRVVVVMFGDSVTTGYGDTEIGNKQGGYVARTQALLPLIEFINLSEQGERSPLYMSRLNDAFGPRPTSDGIAIRKALLVADYVVQDVGRNDHWYRNAPAWSLSNLRFTAALITSGVKKLKGTPPLIITPNFTVPDRDSQTDWVRALNRLILRSSTDKAPANLRLDRLAFSMLRYDRIHPTSEGYAKLATIFSNYLTRTLPLHVKRLRLAAAKKRTN